MITTFSVRKTDRCENCLFSEYDDVDRYVLVCRRYPPVFTTDDIGYSQPDVDNRDWCGEHKKEK